jgi:hypothetical protein
MKTIIIKFIFAYLLAQCNNKVATIIIFFARSERSSVLYLVYARP